MSLNELLRKLKKADWTGNLSSPDIFQMNQEKSGKKHAKKVLKKR